MRVGYRQGVSESHQSLGATHARAITAIVRVQMVRIWSVNLGSTSCIGYISRISKWMVRSMIRRRGLTRRIRSCSSLTVILVLPLLRSRRRKGGVWGILNNLIVHAIVSRLVHMMIGCAIMNGTIWISIHGSVSGGSEICSAVTEAT